MVTSWTMYVYQRVDVAYAICRCINISFKQSDCCKYWWRCSIFCQVCLFTEGWLCYQFYTAEGNSAHSQCLSEEIVLPPHRGMKKIGEWGWGWGGGLQSFINFPCTSVTGWRFRIQRTWFRDTAETGRDVLVICCTFCMVDRTVKCYNLALEKIFQDYKIRSVRFISTCFCFVLKSAGSVLFYAITKNGSKKQSINFKMQQQK